VYGTPAWGKVGRKAVDFAVTYEKELAAKAAKAAKVKAAKAPKDAKAAKPAKAVKKAAKVK